MNREAEEFRISSDIKQANNEVLLGRLDQAEMLLRDAKQFTWDLLSPASLRLRIDEFLASQQVEQAEGFTHFPELMESVQQMDAMLKAEGEHVPDEVFQTEFQQWWKEEGQFCRAGGGSYERTFAFQAWRHLYPKLMQARAALAQPSPEPCHCQLGNCLGAEEGQWCKAQPSPAPELERPEVVAYLNEWRHNDSGGIRVTPALSAMSEEGLQNEYGPQASVVRREPLMTVSQHDRIGLQWASLVHRAQAKADAAQARVAGLEKLLEGSISDKKYRGVIDCLVNPFRKEAKVACAELEAIKSQKPIAYVLFRDGEIFWAPDDGIVISDTAGDEDERRTWQPVYAAPVAQAGQVPDGFALVPANPLEWPLAIGAAQLCKSMSVGCDDEDALHDAMVDMLVAIAAAPAQGDHDA